MSDARASSSSSLFDLSGRTALVTGSTAGLGLMIARGLVLAGMTVIVNSRKQDAVDAVVSQLGSLGEVHGVATDLSTPEDCRALAERVRRVVPRLDLLVNNAAATWGAPLDDFPEQGWDKVLDLNLKAPFFLVQALLPLLEAAARPDSPARIINIGSVDGLRVAPMQHYPYSASKAGLHHLTRQLAADLGPRHVTVNAIAPGWFPSRMSDFAFQDETLHAGITSLSPLSRAGSPDDIIGAVVYLASRAGSFVTGSVLQVDGGITLTGAAGASAQ